MLSARRLLPFFFLCYPSRDVISNSLKPELYISDFQKSLHFYIDILGFTLEYQRENPLFAFLSYQGSQIMIQQLKEHEDAEFMTGKLEHPFGRGINFQIHTDNVERLSDNLKKANYPVRADVQDNWYAVGAIQRGKRELLVQYPDGYLFRFSQSMGER